jgi:putative nucleotidyltransferase with HDIG domain
MGDPRDKRVELILQSLEGLPTLPSVAVQLLELTASRSSTAAQIVRLVETDPALTTRVLKLVNRAETGAGQQIVSVERAVVLLGMDAIRAAVLAVSVFETFQAGGSASSQFSRAEFWKHCIAVACCCESLAEQLRGKSGGGTAIDPSEAFICGLLHDMGKVALDAAVPKSFAKVVEAAELLRGNIADVERTVIGLDHMVVGKRLAERWGLPANLRDCIWLHGQLPAALPSTVANARLLNLVTLADLLAREQHLGYSGNHLFPVSRQALVQALNLSTAQIDATLGRLVEKIESRCVALGLGQTSSSEIYQQAIVRANQELGAVNSQLAARNRKLAIRAKFFDALSGFQAEMRPDAPPSDVLDAIGQTAAALLDVGSVAVFSLPPGCDFAEMVLVNAAGQTLAKSVVETGGARPGVAPSDPGMAERNPVLVTPAEADLEWLLAAISPQLAHANRFWISLTADGRCIGGVLWGAPASELQRLAPQQPELAAMAGGWGLALRTAQIREDSRVLSEQLAEANRRLQNAQSELLRGKTLVVVGEMAAGAAHEMNNPLAVISGRSQLLAAQLEDPKFKASANLIFEQSHRLSQIITELMDFARPTTPEPAQCEVSQLVEEAIREAKASANSVDRTVEVLVADVPAVKVDARQVTAALAEMIANALQATDPREVASAAAKIDVGVEPGVGANDETRAYGHVSVHVAFDPYSQRIVFNIADDGCGMDENTARCAFDPFFSAKRAGRRRGMGLAKALRWVEANGGSIRLESQVGQGTRALVLLPSAGDASAEPEPDALRRQA